MCLQNLICAWAHVPKFPQFLEVWHEFRAFLMNVWFMLFARSIFEMRKESTTNCVYLTSGRGATVRAAKMHRTTTSLGLINWIFFLLTSECKIQPENIGHHFHSQISIYKGRAMLWPIGHGLVGVGGEIIKITIPLLTLKVCT